MNFSKHHTTFLTLTACRGHARGIALGKCISTKGLKRDLAGLVFATEAFVLGG